ncbi:MAG: transglycosylase domain-containing protein, partial [Candidatus Paceibacterota bacterium]
VIPVSSQILDRNGELLFDVFSEQKRKPVKLDKLPVHILQATIAIEDAEFYRHGGISLFGGIARAIKDTFFLQKGLQGGSTITQQLVKSALLTPERTIQRKVREAVLAIWVEKILSKDEILELYLNQVPYGGVAYGIEEAAESYFDKSASELKLHESALLAGLPKAPSAYNPYTNFKRARARQKEVLRRMEELKFITKEQREKAEKAKLNIVPPRQKIKAPHFVFYVKDILEREYGTKLVEEGGLKVTTTLDVDLQASAEAILRDEIDQVKRLNVTNGAILVTRPPTGEILSMVGSVDFFATPSGSFNVTTAERQPGSSFKPINYAAGIDQKKVTAATVFLDTPSCFNAPGQPKSYCPVNYDFTFHGPQQLRYALANSYNIPAVKMMAINGVDTVLTYVRRFLMTTFKDSSRYGLSLTLGGGEVKMTEMAQAFSAFANEGVPKPLVSILKVEDKHGNVLYEYKDTNFVQDFRKPLDYPNFLSISGQRAISKDTAFIISHILQDNNARSAAFGTSSKLVIPGHTVSVKTGTTNDFRDNWTIGYTPNFLTVVWVGNNDNTPMSRVASGVTGAAPIWNRVMRTLLEDQPKLTPRQPNTVIGKHVCNLTGVVSAPANGEPPAEGESTDVSADFCQGTRFEYFIKGTEKIPGAEISREAVPVNRETGYMTKPDDPLVEMQEKTVIRDATSTYCVDCNHENEPRFTINL